MKRKRLAVATGFLGALGLLALFGHKRQVEEQAQDSQITSQVRAFFEPMGAIEVVYMTEVNSRAGLARGGVVFDDGVAFEFRYNKGDIDYRELKEAEA